MSAPTAITEKDRTAWITAGAYCTNGHKLFVVRSAHAKMLLDKQGAPVALGAIQWVELEDASLPVGALQPEHRVPLKTFMADFVQVVPGG